MEEESKMPGALMPKLEAGVYVFVSLPSDQFPEGIDPISTVREPEGISLIVAEQDAIKMGYPILFRAAWISLGAQTDLNALGITAAVSAALTVKGISCNIVAGALHDHVFVPVDRAEEALECLQSIRNQ